MRASHLLEAHVRAQFIHRVETEEGEQVYFYQQELKVRLRCAWRPATTSPLIIFQFVASRRRGRPPVSRPGLPGHLVITLSCVHPVQVGTQLDGTEDRALMLWPITAVHT